MENFEIRPSWANFIDRIILATFAFLGAGFTMFALPSNLQGESSWMIAALFASAGCFIALSVLIKRYSSLYTLKDGMLSAQHGIIARNLTTIHISKIRSINLHQSAMDRLMNTGNLLFLSVAGGGDADVAFHGVDDAKNLKLKIEKLTQGNDKA